MKLRRHAGNRPIGPALIALAITLPGALFGTSGCGAVDFFRRDPAAARDRSSRFDRFVGEVTLNLRDTAPFIEQLRLSERPGDGLKRWDQGRRESIRHSAAWKALQRLEGDFAADKFNGPRAATSRMLARDLRRLLGLTDAENIDRFQGRPPSMTSDAAEADRLSMQGQLQDKIQSLPATPWSGLMIELPSVLLAEQPATTAKDLERWEKVLTALSEEATFLSASPAALVSLENYAYPPIVLDATIDFIVELGSSAGAGGTRDALFGPIGEAEAAFAAATSTEPRSTSSRRRVLQRRIKFELDRLVETLIELRSRLSARPFTGSDALNQEAAATWLKRIRDAAGSSADPSALADLGRSEAQRLKRLLGSVLELDPQAAGFEGLLRAKFSAIRTRNLAPPGSLEPERTPETLWQTLHPQLDGIAVDCPEVLVSSRTARVFERPHGRWSPFVRGNLAAATDPLAQPSTFLASRERDPVTPAWLREAEALRYGSPGCALADAFRRAAMGTVPRYLLVTEREAFTEGWGLYALDVAADADLLLELDGGFGRLTQELISFVTMVTDVGLNAGGWTVQQATKYVVENTPLPQSAATEIVTRVLADPGRPSLPAIGLLRLRSLRRGVEELILEEFVPAEFHAALLKGGPIPMSELDARIETWLAQRSSSSVK